MKFFYKIPILNRILNFFLRLIFYSRYKNSAGYWESRYRQKGTSGPGSYGRLAVFKAEVLNEFVQKHKISRVIEFGCGDGNQLGLASYPEYIGLDVSKKAIELCQNTFRQDASKSFFLYDPFCFTDRLSLFQCDLALSLDVIYHLTEDETFDLYMRHLFSSAKKFVIIYSMDYDSRTTAAHVRQRKFSLWVQKNCPEWELLETIKNKYPPTRGGKASETSLADFFIYTRYPGSPGRCLNDKKH